MSAIGGQFSRSLSTGAIWNDKNLVENLKGLILLVLSSSFTVTMCTVIDYHHVEFQALTSKVYSTLFDLIDIATLST